MLVCVVEEYDAIKDPSLKNTKKYYRNKNEVTFLPGGALLCKVQNFSGVFSRSMPRACNDDYGAFIMQYTLEYSACMIVSSMYHRFQFHRLAVKTT